MESDEVEKSFLGTIPAMNVSTQEGGKTEIKIDNFQIIINNISSNDEVNLLQKLVDMIRKNQGSASVLLCFFFHTAV